MDRLYSALVAPKRRHLLSALREHGQKEEVTPTAVVGDAESNSEHVKIELHHDHLPRLDDIGLIDWDRGRNVVTRGPRFDEIIPLLTACDGMPDDPRAAKAT